MRTSRIFWTRLFSSTYLIVGCLIFPAFAELYLTHIEAKYTGSKIEDCGNNTILQCYNTGISRISINGNIEEKEILNSESGLMAIPRAASCFDEEIIYIVGWSQLFRYSLSEGSLEIMKGFQTAAPISPNFARDTTNQVYLNSDNAIYHLENQGPRELRKMPETGFIRAFSIMDSQDFLVSTSTDWLFHIVGKEIDTIHFPASQIISNIFEGKYLVIRPKDDSQQIEKALLIDDRYRQGQSLDWILEPISESDLKALLATRSVDGKKVVATYFAGKEFRAVYHWDEAGQKLFAKTFLVHLGPSVMDFKVVSAPMNHSDKKFILTSHGLYYLGVESFTSGLARPLRTSSPIQAPLFPFHFDLLGRSGLDMQVPLP